MKEPKGKLLLLNKTLFKTRYNNPSSIHQMKNIITT